MKMIKNYRKFFEQMPKVELHIHLEGAFTFDFLFNLMEKYGGDPSVTNIADLEKKFVFKDFSHFIETWIWKNQFFCETEDFENLAFSTLEDLRNNNIIYLEAFYSPWDFASNGISAPEITEAMLTGIQRARDEIGIECKLIADLSRDLGWKDAIQRFNDILPFRDHGVVGIGLGGSEQKYPPEPFEQVYKMARDKGFHVVAHAGEAAGPESIWGAITKLSIERIGHGVRAVEDPKLIEELTKRQIPLEVCVNSNVRTGVFKTYEEHPIRTLYDQGIMVTVNSDDPTMFGLNLTGEYVLLYENLNFSVNEIKQMAFNGIEASFLSESEKEIYRKLMLEYWM